MDCPIRHYEPIWHTDPAFLNRLGYTADRPADAAWSPENLAAALDYYAGAIEWPPAEFGVELQHTLDCRADELARAVKRQVAEVVGITHRQDAEPERVGATALLPPDAEVDRVVKYERHLHSQMTSTLHEFERLQARRGGELAILPAVADLFVHFNHERSCTVGLFWQILPVTHVSPTVEQN